MLAQPQVAFNCRDLARLVTVLCTAHVWSSCYSLDKLLLRYLLATLTSNCCSMIASYYMASWGRKSGIGTPRRKFPLKLIDLAPVRNLRHQKFQELFCPTRLLTPSFFSWSYPVVYQERIDRWLSRETTAKNCFRKIFIYQIKVDGLLSRGELFYQLLQRS